MVEETYQRCYFLCSECVSFSVIGVLNGQRNNTEFSKTEMNNTYPIFS